MELMTYKTRAVRTLSLLILVALLAALNPPSLTDSSAFAQTAATPTLSSSADTANQVDLSWTAVTGADDYEIWRWETSEGWVEVDDAIAGTSYSDTGVTAGNTYYYQVSADGGSTWSNRVNETVGAYDASTLNAPTVTSSSVSLTWSAVTGATSYELWRYETSWAQVGGALTGTGYTDTSVEIGKTYYYQVMANGPAGDGAWSNRVEASVPTTTPGAPLNFTATPGDAQASLSWDPPASDGGAALTGYQYRYQAVGGTWSSWTATTPALSRTATVTGLANETAHNFEVQAVNSNGAGATAAASATPMSTPPGIPTSLEATSQGPTEITLSWTAAAGAASYQLQRRTNGGNWGSPMDVGSGTTYTDTGLNPSTTYDYEVRAVNPAGESAWSAVYTVPTTAPTAPDMPSLTATAGASNIMLSWSAPASNGAAISGYDIDVSDDGSDWSDLATAAAGDTSHDHTNLGPGTMNYYRIRAMNSVGYSDWSASVSATVPAVKPGVPSLIATAGDGMIMLTWVAPAANGGADITGYTIQVSSDGNTGWGNLASKAADDTTHDHTGLTAGTTRYYRISARNSVGSGAWSDVASATIGGADPPAYTGQDTSSPRSLTVTQVAVGTDRGTSTASLTVTWVVPTDPPSDDDTNTELDYEAEVWNPATQTWGTVMNATSATDSTPVAAPITVNAGVGGSLTDSGLKGTTEYTYRVRAVDGTGSSAVRGAWSALNVSASGTTVAVSPSQPMLTATAMGTDKIVLTWTVPDDGGSDIIGYVLVFGTDSSTVTTNLDAAGETSTNPVMLDAAQQRVTHTGLDPNEDYFYQISALNSVVATTDLAAPNAAWSALSDEASATTGRSAPSAPTTLGLDSTTAGQIAINVAHPTNTGGADITTTEIQVYNAANDSWTILQDAAGLTYTHSGLGANVTMYYRARGKNELGDGEWLTQSATTSAGVPGAPKLTATVNGPSSITLSWTAPNDGGNAILDYTIQISTDGTTFNEATADDSGLGPDDVTADSRTATHTGLRPGDTRHYQVLAVNTDGSTASNTATARTATGNVPGAPTWATPALTATTATTVLIDWEAPQVGTPAADDPSVTGYDIAMWEDGEWVIIASNVAIDPTAYLESGLSGMTDYYFSVRARNANGAGSWSTVEDTTTLAGAPGKPELTAMADGATKIVLTWTAPDSGGGTITNYLVQVSNNGTTGWVPLQDTPGAATDDHQNTSGLSAALGGGEATNVTQLSGSTDPAPPLTVTHEEGITGMTRKYYRVLASNGDPATAENRGMWSNVMDATTPAGKPGQVTLAPVPSTEQADSFVISWTEPATGGSAITGYQVQVWDSSGGMWTDLMSVGGSATSYTHTGIPGASTRHYRVRAMNAVGYGDWSASQTRTTGAGKPGAPVLHADQNGSSEIRLTWTAPATGEAAGGTGITNYQIQVSDDGQSGWTAPETSSTIVDGDRVHQTATGTVQNYSDTDLAPAVTKHYRVRAVNGQGVGPWSNVAMASTLGGRPGRPDLTATASGTSIINLAWTPPTGDGGSAVTGYEIEYWDGSNGWMDLVALDDSVTAYTHRNIVGGVTKFYRIRAENAAGSGNWSTTAYATTATTVPSPPTLVATADGAAKIVLTWTAGHDGGLAITAYSLQHSSDAGRTWADIHDDSIAPGLTMSYTDDKDITGGTTKHYRIRATNSKGAGGWSPLASAKTDTSIPGRPTVKVNGVAGGVDVSWTKPPTKTGGSAIIRFEVQRWDAANRRWVDRLTTSSTQFRDSGLTTGKKYFYRVRAVNAMGDGPWSTFRGAEAE